MTAHTPAMHDYLFHRSHTATGREAKWNNIIFDSITWQHLGQQAFQKHTMGQRNGLSKYMKDLLPTLCHLQTFNNQSNSHCFACNQLWEDTNHVLHCQTEDRCTTRTVAFQTFCLYLQKHHTPNIMATLICNSMHSWINCTWISPPVWDPPKEPIMHASHQAFQVQ
jgi:hypothetical protein